jgi:hypothetical protein
MMAPDRLILGWAAPKQSWPKYKSAARRAFTQTSSITQRDIPLDEAPVRA